MIFSSIFQYTFDDSFAMERKKFFVTATLAFWLVLYVYEYYVRCDNVFSCT